MFEICMSSDGGVCGGRILCYPHGRVAVHCILYIANINKMCSTFVWAIFVSVLFFFVSLAFHDFLFACVFVVWKTRRIWVFQKHQRIKKNRHKWKIAHTIYVMKTDEKFTFCSQWIDVDSNAAALTHWTQKPTRKQWREWTGHYGETQRDKGGGVGFIKLHVMTQLRCRVKMFIREYSVILHIWAWCRCNHMQWVEVIATMIVRTSF